VLLPNPSAKFRTIAYFLAGGLGWFEQHLENSSGQGCPAEHVVRQSEHKLQASPFASLRARPELAEAKDEKFLVGEFRAVLREASQTDR